MISYIKFTYLYRDGSNYKRWGEVILSNPEKLTIREIDKRLRDAFEQKEFFVAHQLDVPEVFLYADGKVDSDDHCYHEYHSVQEVESSPENASIRSVTDLLLRAEEVAQVGWRAFDPRNEISRIQERLSATD